MFSSDQFLFKSKKQVNINTRKKIKNNLTINM